MITELDQIRDTTNIDIKVLYDIVGDFQKSFGKEINVVNLVDAVTRLMKLVGRISKLSGDDKKFIVTKLLIFMVKETGEGEIDEIMDSILINIIPTIIDKLISVENGKLVFNKNATSACCWPRRK